jgi:hypothetical protein
MEARRAWTWIGVLALVVVLAWLVAVGPDEPITLQTAKDPIVRGSRLNHSTLNPAGYVDQAPYELLGEASDVYGEDLPEDLYALARSGRSEGVDGMEARMHVMLNQAAESGMTLFQRATTAGARDGYYGRQSGRRWSTAEDPYAGDVDLAKRVLADRAAGLDPTGGAGRYFDKGAFGKQRGTTANWQDKLVEWQGEGYVAYYYPNASDNLVLFRRGSAPEGFETLA